MNNNAKIVVENWAQGNHQHAWNPPAQDARPSVTIAALAQAYARISIEIDRQASELVAYGFQPGHQSIRKLREKATEFARMNQSTAEWSSDLREAEQAVLHQATMEETL